jgi:hypothetical protein
MSQFFLIAGNMALPLCNISNKEMDSLEVGADGLKRNLQGYPMYISEDGRLLPEIYDPAHSISEVKTVLDGKVK